MADKVLITSGETCLSGTLFRAHPPRAVAVLHGATGVPHSYYRHFAEWLARDRNVTCLTYDYRDFGASRAGHMRSSKATMTDWGVHDQQAVRDWLETQEPGLPLWVIGHSLGGFMLAHQTGTDRIARIIAVCSGPVHYTDHPWPYQAGARWFWFVLAPILIAAYGYLPARLSGLGAPIPKGVFNQWKLWCTSRGFHDVDRTLPPPEPQNVTAPLRSVAFEDDLMMPPHVVERLGQMYPETLHTHVTIDPSAHDLTNVGHLAAFSRRNRAIWPLLIGT